MKTIAGIITIVLLGSFLYAAGEIKSGKISYKVEGHGKMMGSDIESSGKKTVVFDEYGLKSLIEEEKEVKRTIGDKTKIKKVHTLVYMNGDRLYTVDFKQKKIIKMDNPSEAEKNSNLNKSAEKVMEQIGGKKIGSRKILGYTCDIWKILENEQCIYRGVVLKVNTNILDMTGTMEATRAEFDIQLNQNDFKLPNFPLYDISGKKLKQNTDLL